jgi:hypothetical protein
MKRDLYIKDSMLNQIKKKIDSNKEMKFMAERVKQLEDEVLQFK